jgi:hypothetical protein
MSRMYRCMFKMDDCVSRPKVGNQSLDRGVRRRVLRRVTLTFVRDNTNGRECGRMSKMPTLKEENFE